jgi:maleate isomerase
MALPYELTKVRPKQLGLVVLQSDETIELDMRRLLPLEAELLVSRVPSGTTLDTGMIAAMEGKLTAAAALFPEAVKLAAAGYGCTSASAQIGSARVAETIRAGVDTAHVSDPVAALIAACRALDVRRLGLISPYVATVSDRLRVVLEDAGIAVTRFDSFEEPIEANVVRITGEALRSAAVDMGGHTDCDAVFLSCTNLRTLDIIDRIEAEIGKPVLASNQVLAWHMLQLAGIEARALRPGRLWRV